MDRSHPDGDIDDDEGGDEEHRELAGGWSWRNEKVGAAAFFGGVQMGGRIRCHLMMAGPFAQYHEPRMFWLPSEAELVAEAAWLGGLLEANGFAPERIVGRAGERAAA